MERIGDPFIPSLFSSVCSLIRSQRVSLSIVAQDVSQIDNVYGQNEANTIIANMSSHLILPGIMNSRTLDHYQKLIGVESRKEVGENGKVHINKRDLLTNDELRRIPKNMGLFLFSNENPVKLRMCPIFKNMALMAKAGIRSKNNKLVATTPSAQIRRRLAKDIHYMDLEWLKNYVQQGKKKGEAESSKSTEIAIAAQ